MKALCDANGAELILIKAPTNVRAYWWYDEWDIQVREYADQKGIAYYNFISETEQIGIDYTTDTYDEGVHLNVYGAEKMTDYFGNILKSNHGLDGLEHSDQLVLDWAVRVEEYYKERNG